MDPIPNSPVVPPDLAALLGLSVSGKETKLQATLLAMVGQELDFLFEASVPEGVRLRLPQGQILVAQGELPYPEGTVLRVQVLPPPPGETAPRLQTLAAKLPPAHPLLAPLVEGEAAPLLQRLQTPDPPPPLRALAQLFQHLDSLVPIPAPPEAGIPGSRSESLPEIPPSLREPLRQALLQLLPPESPESVIRRWLATPPLRSNANPGPPSSPPTPIETEEAPLPPPFRKILETLADPVELPPEVRVALAAALAPRLPPRPLEALILDWHAQSPAASRPPLGGPSQPPIQGAEEGLLPASGPGSLPPDLREVLPARLAQVSLVLREPLQALFKALGLPHEPLPAPVSASSRPAPAPLAILLSSFSQPDLKALARSLGLPGVPSPPELLLALREPGRILPSVAQLELAGLPEPLARVLVSAVAGQGEAPRLPSPQVLEGRLSSWPEPQRLELAQFLAPPGLQPFQPKATPQLPTSPRDLAEALLRWIQALEPEAPPAPVLPAPRPVARRDLPIELPAEAWKLLNHPAIPPELKETARIWLKAFAAPLPRSEPPPREPAPHPALKDLPVDPGVKAGLEARLAGPASEVLAHSEPWGGWVEASLRTLANPAASPREAPFHALQALDGTAYFEIPLPGRASGPLQVWVEKDPTGEAPDAPPLHKVLLGLRFTALGEARVGLLQSTGTLSVRIWAEHPAVLHGGEAALREELESLGDRVSLRIAALPLGSPTPRSLAVGPGYQGLA